MFICLTGLTTKAQILFDGETNIPGIGGWANSPEVIDNPKKEGINTSDKVISWQKKDDGNAWNGVSFSTSEGFNIFSNAKLRVKIYAPKQVMCAAQLVNGDDKSNVGSKTVEANKWVQLEWDLSSEASKTYLVVELFPGNAASEDILFYIDDVEFVNCEIIEPAGLELDINYIMIDQFGYRPYDQKIAVIANPEVGFNADDSFQAGSVYQVRNVSDDAVVYEGNPVVWQNGALDALSGDYGWWFDFTALTSEGEYYVYDVENDKKSYGFKIAPDVYKDLLKAAIRMFYYQRIGIAHEAVYAGETWVDDAAYLQDSATHYLEDRENADLFRDLQGGWMDAGDFNKYVTFVERPIHQLLRTYEENPHLFTDDFNIPESGNGIPDILDEVKWELDWVMKMQDMDDGGVFIKMGNIDHSFDYKTLPSNDKRTRYYGPKCSSSTICAAGFFAHAALVYSEFPEFSSFVSELELRAEMAYDHYQANPKYTDCDDQTIQAGDADMSLDQQERVEVEAAIYLFALTGEEKYHTLVKSNYTKMRQMTSEWVGDIEKGQALLYYTSLPDADETVKMAILNKKTSDGQTTNTYFPMKHLYRANVANSYYWGGNSTRADCGNANFEMITYGLDSASHTRYRDRTIDILHYFHGINPFNMVYLTTMQEYGAENYATEIYHGWYNEGTPLDTLPAPGYLPGGPNMTYQGSEEPPKNQPPDKSYLNFNGGSNHPPSWEITEPMCSYQATYVMLVSKFAEETCNPDLTVDSVRIDSSKLEMTQGDSYTLSTVLKPYGVCNPYLQFASSDTLIATVDFTGKISALEPGVVDIIVNSIADPEKTDTCELTVIECIRTPWDMVSAVIPGMVEAENYDIGCGKSAYSDFDETNNGLEYRNDEVDIEICSEGGYNVGWIEPGEWLEYTVTIQETMDYDITLYIASSADIGALEVAFPESEISTGEIELPVTGGWQNWETVIARKIGLEAGEQIMRINMIASGFNLDKIEFAEADTTITSLEHTFPKAFDFDVTQDGSELLIQLHDNTPDKYTLWMVDIAGRKMLNRAIEDQSTVVLSTDRFKNGVYFVCIENQQVRGIKKVVIIN